MIQTIEKLQEIFLVGISARTNNKDEFNPETAKIGTVINKYFSESLSSKILNRKNPGTTYSVLPNTKVIKTEIIHIFLEKK